MKEPLHYFNTGHVALPTRATCRAVADWAAIVGRIGSDSDRVLGLIETGDFSTYLCRGLQTPTLSECWDGLEALYERLANLLHVIPDNLVLLPTFLDSLLLTMRSVANQGYESLVYTDIDHPNVIEGIRAYGRTLGIVCAPCQIESNLLNSGDVRAAEDMLIAAARSQRHTVLFVPHVDYRYGFVFDIARIANELGPTNAIIVDAAHSVGQFDFALPTLGICILLGSGHKWLGGWRASSFICCAGEPALTTPIRSFLAAQTHVAFSTYERVTQHTRFVDWGSVCEFPLISLGAGLRRIEGKSIQKVEADVMVLTERLNDSRLLEKWHLVSANNGKACGIRFLIPRSSATRPDDLVYELRRTKNIAASAFLNGKPGIRLCISHDNRAYDIDALIEALLELT